MTSLFSVTNASILRILIHPPLALAAQVPAPTALQSDYRAAANRLIDAALADSAAYGRLAELVDNFGYRLSGSESLERAIGWVLSSSFSNLAGSSCRCWGWAVASGRRPAASPLKYWW